MPSLHALLPTMGRQLGLFTLRQWTEAGLTRRQLEGRIASGEIRRLVSGVHLLSAAPPTYEQRLLAGCLATDGAVSHRAAFATWGVSGIDAQVVGVMSTRARAARVRGVHAHITCELPARDVRRIGPLPVTSPARTLVDVAPLVGPKLLRRAIDEWVVARHLTLVEAWATARRLANGRRGPRLVRAALEDWVGDEGADSAKELQTLRLLVSAGLPDPTVHHLVVLDGSVIAELDISWPEGMVFVEFDGFGSHSTRDAFERDRERQNRLVVLGWAPLRVTAEALRRHPERIVAEARALLTARMRQAG